MEKEFKVKAPKFNKGDKAWYITSDNKIDSDKIYDAQIFCRNPWEDKPTFKIYYQTEYYHWVNCNSLEDKYYKTKEEAKDALLKRVTEYLIK